jgi:hypothetical protein
MITQRSKQIAISTLLGIFYGVCLYALVQAGGGANSGIWSFYGGIVMCVLIGVSISILGTIPARPQQKIFVSMLTGGLWGMLLLSIWAIFGNKSVTTEPVLFWLGMMMWGIAGILLGYLVGLGNTIVMSHWRQLPPVAQVLVVLGVILGLFNIILGVVIVGVAGGLYGVQYLSRANGKPQDSLLK